MCLKSRRRRREKSLIVKCIEKNLSVPRPGRDDRGGRRQGEREEEEEEGEGEGEGVEGPEKVLKTEPHPKG